MIIIYIHINRGVCHDIRYMIIYIYIMEFAMIYDICPVFFVCVYIYSVVAVGNLE